MPVNRISLIILLSIFFGISFSQNIFILEKPGTIKNYKYYQNNQIKIKTHSSDTIIKGTITYIRDSSIIIDYANEIYLNDMALIYKKRWGFSFLQTLFFAAGGPYLLISMLNGLINDDSPIIPKETLIISGSLIVAGIALTPLTTRRCKIDNKKWRVKILDFTE